ncbi:VCBS domain-containing protein [Aeromonas hydrophila]|nr:VCBS domain-containing protein [Aeromonas hydrophila]MDD9226624.1 VCBS domain-containing protein [Aeromonas hydrophila]
MPTTFRTDVAAVAHPAEVPAGSSLTITEGGAWTYNVDNSKVEYLGEGETKVETCGQVRGRHRAHRHRHHHRHQRQGDHQGGDAEGAVTEGNGNIVLSDSGT